MANLIFSRASRPSGGNLARRLLPSLLLLLVLSVSFAAGSAQAQCTLSSPTTWNMGGNGNWSTNGDWNPAVFPNSSATNVCITNGTSTVTLDTNASVADLQLATGNILTTNLGTQLSVFGTQILNAGQIVLNGGGGANTLLTLDNNVTLSGGGTVNLNVAGGGGSTFIQQGVGGLTLTNADNTIQGAGIIGNNGLALTNDAGGTINANVSGATLTLNGGGLIGNAGLLEGTNGGFLQIENTVNNAGGNITANGGTVQVFASATIQGGTLNTLNGGTLGTPAGNVAFLDGSTGAGAVTVSTGSTYTSDLGSQTLLLGTINNKGNIQLNGGGGNNTILQLVSNTTLQGGGTVTLSTAGGGGSAFVQQNVGGLTLTNVDNTIQGNGVIGNNGLALTNNAGGTIKANVSGGTLTLNGGGLVSNAGLLEATNGGTLQIENTVNNAGGNITANGGTVQMINATVQGGTLNAVSGGTLETLGGFSATLDGSNAGALTISSNTTYTSDFNSQTALLGTITNNGNIQVNGGGGTNSFLFAGSNVTLQGGGTVTLSTTSSGGGNAIIEQSVGGLTLTNVNNTIQGEGIIGNNGLTLLNQSGGTINANSTGGALITTLTLDSTNVTNIGLLEATNSGVLNLNGITVNNAGGNITANGAGTTVQFFGSAVIQGGTLNNNGGTLGTPANNVATLDGTTQGPLTINGTYTSDLNSQTFLLGTINNNNLQLDGGGGTNSVLFVGSNVTLQGGGTVTLSTTASGGGNAIIEQSVGGLTLTNVNNTIQGEGIIGNNGLTLVNKATIDANSTGGALITTLTLGSVSVTNTGLLEATNSGVLNLNGITVNNAGGNIAANGAGTTVQFFGSAVIQGGTLTNNGGTLGTPANNVATLDGTTQGPLTINGTYTSDLNSQTSLLGTINNQGNIQLNGGGGTNTFLLLDTNTTLQGGGTVTMNVAGGGGSTFIQQAVGGVTLTNESTIQGAGVIGNGGLTVINAPGGVFNANTSGQTLVVNPGGGLTNTGGTLEASNGGTLAPSSAIIDNLGGTIKVDGAASAVQLVNGVTIQGGTLTTTNGGSLGVPNGFSATLDGSSQGALTLSAGSTFVGNLNSQTNLVGVINNNGNIQVNGGSGTNSVLFIDSGNVTLQGGGTVTLSTTASGGGQAIIEQSVGGLTLTNVNNTIQGEGIIGNNGLTLLNQSGGTINANSTGGPLTTTLTIDSAAVTNTGLMEATNSGVLQLNGITVNNAGGNITANGAGATVQFFGSAVIQGGTLTNNGGTLGTPANNVATLDGTTQGSLTINGTYTSDLNSQTTLLGTINNNNNLQLNGGGGTNSVLLIDSGNVMLQGGGTVTLSTTASGGGNAIIEQSVGGLTLTNVNNTIQGEGIIGNNGLTLVNKATIDANSTGGALTTALTLDSASVTNTGLLEATNSGVLNLNGITVNNAGGNITANGAGATVQFFGSAVIQGGTLTNNGGTLGTPANNVATLDGTTQGSLTINGTYTSDLNSQTSLLGTINNKGNIQLNGGGGTNTFLTLSANTALQGGGTVTMNVAGGGGSTFIQQAVGGLTLENFNDTIQGAGIVGNNGLSVLNDAGGTINANAAAQALTLNGGGGLTNAGLLEASGTGVLSIANSTINNTNNSVAGTIQANGAGSTVQFVDGAVINGGNLEGNGTLAVASLGTVTLSGGKLTPGFSGLGTPATLALTGNLNQTGGIYNELFSATGNGLLNVSGLVTLGLGPTLTLGPLNGFNVVIGSPIDILNYGTLSGQFSNGTSITADGYNWSIIYDFNNLNEVVLDAISKVGPTDVTATWSTVSGNWNTPSEWACAPGPATCAPNNNGSTVYETVVNSPGNMLTLDNSGGPITVNTLALQAGRLDVASGASLNLVNQPNGITDIPAAAGLILAGTFTTGGSTSALAQLGSVEGLLTLANGQTTSVTPGSGTLTNSGTVNVQQTTALSVAGNLTNSGAINTGSGVSDTGNNSLTVSGSFTNNGSLALDALKDSVSVGSLTNAGGIGLNGANQTLTVSGPFTNANSGIFTIGGSADVASVAGGLTNNGGVVNVIGNGNTLNVGGLFSNALPGIITVGATGTLNANGGFSSNGGVVVRDGSLNVTSGGYGNSGTLTMTGIAGGNVSVIGGFDNSGGAVTMNGTGDKLSADSFTNGGAVVVGGNESLNVGGNYTQTAGSTDVTGNLTAASYTQSGGGTTIEFGGTITAPTFTVAGGNVQGGGSIVGNVTNTGGTVSPIDAGNPSTLTIIGNYAQGVNGMLMIDLGGTGAGQFSVLSISGTAMLDGTVEFMAVNGFAPGIGDSFTFLLASLGVSGTFADEPPVLTNFVCPAGATCTDVYGPTSVTFEINKSTTVTPEPGTLLLLGTGLLGLGGYLGRARKSARKR